MRYFKCKKTNVPENAALREQYKKLAEDEKKSYRKEKVLNALAIIVLISVAGICFVGCGIAIGQIPKPENWLLVIFFAVGEGILFFIALTVSVIIGMLASAPIFNKLSTDRRVIEKDILSKACAYLREYYELQEPCIVTKCYHSSDEKFINHDVCIFVVGDELRITVNLKHGFFHSENDLGCYAFKVDEISVAKQEGEKFLIAELKADDTVFLLGYRAKSFIEKNFIAAATSK